MTLNGFIFSPVGFLCCVLLLLITVAYWIDLFRRLAEAQKEYDKSIKRCHCCKQHLHF